jgi:surface polysaccharide O-acyltransferase-like enzyme
MILVMISLILSGISLINIHVGGYFVQDMIPQRVRLWTWLLYFLLGYILSNIVVDKNKILYIATAILTVISILWQNKLCYQLTGQVDSACMYDDLFIIAWCACIFLVFRRTKILQKLSKFAPYSFGAFLLHSFFVDALNLRALPKNALESTLIWAGLVVVCFTLSWLFSKIPYVKKTFVY